MSSLASSSVKIKSIQSNQLTFGLECSYPHGHTTMVEELDSTLKAECQVDISTTVWFLFSTDESFSLEKDTRDPLLAS